MIKHIFPMSVNTTNWCQKTFVETTKYGFITSEGEELIDISCNQASVLIGYDRHDLYDHVHMKIKKIGMCPSELQSDTPETSILSERIHNQRGFKSIFALSGSDSIDQALKCVSYYHTIKQNKQKKKIVSFKRSFHGSNFLNLKLTDVEKDLKGISLDVANNDCFIRIQSYNINDSFDEYEEKTINNLKRLFNEQGDQIACVVQETASWGSHLKEHTSSYWQNLYTLCKEHDVLLVIDDIALSGGKTGDLFGFTHQADIVCVGKAFGSGYFPLSVCCIGETIQREVDKSFYAGGYTNMFYQPGIVAANYYHNLLKKEALLEKVPSLINQAKDVFRSCGLKFHHCGTLFFVEFKKQYDALIIDQCFRDAGLNISIIFTWPLVSGVYWQIPLVADDYYFTSIEQRLKKALTNIQ